MIVIMKMMIIIWNNDININMYNNDKLIIMCK